MKAYILVSVIDGLDDDVDNFGDIVEVHLNKKKADISCAEYNVNLDNDSVETINKRINTENVKMFTVLEVNVIE